MRRFLDYDPLRGVKEFFVYDESERKWHIEYIGDTDSIVERNKILQNHTDGYTPSRDFRRVAHIPDIIILKWMKEDGLKWWDKNDWPAIKRKLNDPEWRFLRTSPGRI